MSAPPETGIEQVEQDAIVMTGASVISGGLWFLLSGVLPQVFTLVTSIAAARFLEPAGMGRQSFISFVTLSVVTLFASGLSIALMRGVAETIGARRPGSARGLVRWARRIQLGGAAGGAAVLLAFVFAGQTPMLAWALAAGVAALSVLQTVPNAVLIGAQRYRASVTVGLVTGGLATPAIVVVLALGGGISGMFAVELAMVAANLVWTTILSRRALGQVAPGPAVADPELREATTRYALYGTAGAVLTLVVWRRSEFFFLAHYSGDVQIALYSIAFAGATALTSVLEKLGAVMSSAFATMYGAGERDRLAAGYARTLRLLSLAALPLTAMAIGGGPAAINVVYGADYADAGVVLVILLLVVPMIPLWSASASLLVAVGDVRSPLIAGVIAAVFNIALAFALVPSIDAVGAAIASVGAQAVATAVMFRYARRRLGRHTAAWSTGPMLRTTAASIAGGGVTLLICDLLGGPAGLALGTLTGLAVLAVLLLALRPLPGDDAAYLDGQVGGALGGRLGVALRRLSGAGTRADTGFRLAVYCEGEIMGGAEQSLGNLLEHLDPSIDVVVLGKHRPTVEALAARRPGSQTHVLPAIGRKWHLRQMTALVRTLRRYRPAIFQVTMSTPWSARHAVLIGSLVPGVKVVAVEQLPMPAPAGWQRRLKRIAARRLAGHVSVGDAAARELERYAGLEPGSVGVIHNGVEPPAAVAPAAARDGAPPRFGTLARLDPQKGLADWLQALGDLPGAEAEIVGDGPLRGELERQAHELGLAGRVRFLGWRTDSRELLARWDAFVLPSHLEGFPLAIVEAMLAGVPVIATDVGSVGEAVHDGRTGLLVEPGRPDALAGAAARLTADPELAGRLAGAGRAYALEHFTAATMARKYEALYASILGHRG